MRSWPEWSRVPVSVYLAAGTLLLLGMAWPALLLLAGLAMSMLSVAPDKDLVRELLMPLLPHLAPAGMAVLISFRLLARSRLFHVLALAFSSGVLLWLAPPVIRGESEAAFFRIPVMLALVALLSLLYAAPWFWANRRVAHPQKVKRA